MFHKRLELLPCLEHSHGSQNKPFNQLGDEINAGNMLVFAASSERAIKLTCKSNQNNCIH